MRSKGRKGGSSREMRERTIMGNITDAAGDAMALQECIVAGLDQYLRSILVITKKMEFIHESKRWI